jgi:hypothetical protein
VQDPEWVSFGVNEMRADARTRSGKLAYFLFRDMIPFKVVVYQKVGW